MKPVITVKCDPEGYCDVFYRGYLSGEFLFGFSNNHKVVRATFFTVRPQRQGIGTEAYHQIENWLRSRGVKEIRIDRPEYLGAGRFWEKMGYQRTPSTVWVKILD